MPAPKVSEAEFIELWRKHKSPSKLAELLSTEVTAIYARRRAIEQRRGIKLETVSPKADPYRHISRAHEHRQAINLGIENGTVLVFSDAHFWPGIRTTAFKGLLWAIDHLKPKAIINNGDAFDGASISRHPAPVKKTARVLLRVLLQIYPAFTPSVRDSSQDFTPSTGYRTRPPIFV